MYKKAFTLSFDDGVFQDRRFINLLNRYGLKGTFNLNGGLFSDADNCSMMSIFAEIAPRMRMCEKGLKELYDGHEVAVHGYKHLDLSKVGKEETEKEILEDAKKLSELFGYKIEGAAYAFGTTNEYAEDIYKKAGIKYSRGVVSTQKFDPSENMYMYDATCHQADENLFDLAKEFIELKPDKPQIFYVWGHTYEFDYSEEKWERIEEFFKLISGHDDILYGTNKEVFEYFNLI